MDSHVAFYVDRLVIAFLIYGALWACLIVSRQVRLSLRLLFVILLGFAILAAIAAAYIRAYERLLAPPLARDLLDLPPAWRGECSRAPCAL
jgi:hypothetical protein